MLQKKILGILTALLAVAFIFSFVACTRGGGGGKKFTDVAKVEDWLASQKGGASPDDPIPFSVQLNLQNMASPESNWQKLLTSINTAGLYVALDLSGCTMPTTEFDADGGITTGKKFIVSLVLPDSAESVIGGFLSGHFDNLKTAKVKYADYLIGNPGPAGGFVFYDKGDSSDGWRYLEAAPVETEFNNVQWGAYHKNVAGTEWDIGSGKRNTEIIVAYLQGTGETGSAAQVCDALTVNGFGDWFLPSINELDLMYQNLKANNVGGFGNGWYWSSSQYRFASFNCAWTQRFVNGVRYSDRGKFAGYSVRAVRAF